MYEQGLEDQDESARGGRERGESGEAGSVACGGEVTLDQKQD